MTLTPLWAATRRPLLIISPIATGKRTTLLNSITEEAGIKDPFTNSDRAILTGKEPIEELRERVQAISSHRPDSLSHTYLVCENLHGLTKQAAGILLKLLEQPPAHLKIGLTATTYTGIQRALLSRAMTIHQPAGEIPKPAPQIQNSEAGPNGVSPEPETPLTEREGTQ